MRRTFILAILAMTAFSSAVIADDFCVVKVNQSLTQVAGEHGFALQEILDANPQIFNPALVRTGQRIKIPAGRSSLIKTEPKSRIPEAGFFLWMHPGRDRFGEKRDFAKAIRMFNLPDEEAKEHLIAEVKAGRWAVHFIHKGDVFSQMIFGNYRLVNNVQAAWSDSSHVEKAKEYLFELNGFIYHLVCPECYNWSWWREKAPEKPVVVMPEPEPEPELLVIETPPPPSVPVVPEKEKESIFARLNETYLWAGHYFPTQGTGGGNYYGGKSNFFFSTKGVFLGRFHLGVGAIANGWEGTTGSGFSYNGYRATVGPVLDMTMKNYRFTVSPQFGFQNDQGRDGKGYKSEQDDSILYFGLTADSYNEFFKVRKVEAWLDFVFDIDHSKKSWWSSNRIARSNDPAGNKGSINFGSRYYLWAIKDFKTGIVAKSSYAYEDKGVTGIVGFVLSSRQDVYKFGVEFKNTSNSKYQDANGNSIGVTFDLEPKKVF